MQQRRLASYGYGRRQQVPTLRLSLSSIYHSPSLLDYFSGEDEEEARLSVSGQSSSSAQPPSFQLKRIISNERKGTNENRNGDSKKKPLPRGSVDSGLSTPSEEMYHPMPSGSMAPVKLKSSGGAAAAEAGVDGWLIDSLRELGLENDSRNTTNGSSATPASPRGARSPPPIPVRSSRYVQKD